MQGSIPARSNFSVWCSLVARVPRAHEVEGSNPCTLTFENSFAWVAQLAVQRAVNPPALRAIGGSSPSSRIGSDRMAQKFLLTKTAALLNNGFKQLFNSDRIWLLHFQLRTMTRVFGCSAQPGKFLRNTDSATPPSVISARRPALMSPRSIIIFAINPAFMRQW